MRLYLVKGASRFYREDFRRKLIAPGEHWLLALNSTDNRDAIFASRITDAHPNNAALRTALLQPDAFSAMLPHVKDELLFSGDAVKSFRRQKVLMRLNPRIEPEINCTVDLSQEYMRFMQQRRAAMLGRVCDVNARQSVKSYGSKFLSSYISAKQNTLFLSFGINSLLSDLAYNGHIPESRYIRNDSRWSLVPVYDFTSNPAEHQEKIAKLSTYLARFAIRHAIGSIGYPSSDLFCSSWSQGARAEQIYLADDTDLIRLFDRTHQLGLSLAVPVATSSGKPRPKL